MKGTRKCMICPLTLLSRLTLMRRFIATRPGIMLNGCLSTFLLRGQSLLPNMASSISECCVARIAEQSTIMVPRMARGTRIAEVVSMPCAPHGEP